MPKPHPVYPSVITKEVPPGFFVAVECVIKPVHGEGRGLYLDFLADDGRSGQSRLRVVGPMKKPDVPGTEVLDEDGWDIAGQCVVSGRAGGDQACRASLAGQRLALWRA